MKVLLSVVVYSFWLAAASLSCLPAIADTVRLGFDGDYENKGDEQVVFNSIGKLEYIEGEDGMAAGFSVSSFSNGSFLVSENASQRLSNVEKIVVDVSLKLSGEGSETMRPIWLHGAFGLQIRHNNLSFVFFTENDGVVWDVNTTARVLFDEEWHRIIGTYDSISGIAQLVVDGRVVAEKAGFSGKIPSVNRRSLTIGTDSWGKDFSGWIDSLSIEARNTRVGAGFNCDLSYYDHCEDKTLLVSIDPILNVNGDIHETAKFTWHFNSDGKPAKIGKFVNGDYWIAPASGSNSVTFTQISGSGAISVDANLNIEQMGLLDGSNQYGNYDPQQNITTQLPMSFDEKTSLVAAIKRDEVKTTLCGTKQIRGECVDAYQVLTVLPEVPKNYGAGMFRPPIANIDFPLISIDDFDLSILPSLDVFDGASQTRLEDIRRRWSHSIEVLSLVSDERKQFSEGGRAFRAHILVSNYGTGTSVNFFEDLFTLMSSANSLNEKRQALSAMLTYGLDIYHAAHNSNKRHRFYGSGAGQNAGKFMPAVFAAALAKDKTMATVLSRVSSEVYATNELRPQEIAQINLGPNGPVWGDRSSRPTRRLILGAYWGQMLKSQCFEGALGTCSITTGSKNHRDPYFLIDGPPNLPGTNYMAVTIGTFRAFAAVMQLVPGVCEIVNYPAIIEYVDRVQHKGVSTDFDHCAPPDYRENPDTCDAYRQRGCQYYGLSNTGVATWGPDPNNLQQCIENADGQNGRFPKRHGERFKYLYTVSQVERNWDWIKRNALLCH